MCLVMSYICSDGDKSSVIIRMLEYSFSRLFVPWYIRSYDGTYVLGTIPWNFRSRYPGPFLPRTIRSFVSRAVPGPLTKKEQRLYFTEFFRTIDIYFILFFTVGLVLITFALKIIILHTQWTMYCYGRR